MAILLYLLVIKSNSGINSSFVAFLIPTKSFLSCIKTSLSFIDSTSKYVGSTTVELSQKIIPFKKTIEPSSFVIFLFEIYFTILSFIEEA